MKIVSIQVHAVAIEMAYTFQFSLVRTQSSLDTTVVRIETDTGHSGWGEVCAQASIGIMIGETAGAKIAAAAVAHLVSTTPPSICMGAWYPPECNKTRLALGGAIFENGVISIETDAPGLGVEPDLALLGAPVAVFR